MCHPASVITTHAMVLQAGVCRIERISPTLVIGKNATVAWKTLIDDGGQSMEKAGYGQIRNEYMD